MIEIGSYMGESTMLTISTGVVVQLMWIEPHDGYEKFNGKNDYTWDRCKERI